MKNRCDDECIYNILQVLWPRACNVNCFFHNNTILENTMQWRFNFLQDIQLYYKFLSGKNHREEGDGGRYSEGQAPAIPATGRLGGGALEMSDF